MLSYHGDENTIQLNYDHEVAVAFIEPYHLYALCNFRKDFNMADKQKINKLKIATGSLRRLLKEYKMYIQELAEQQKTVETMKQNNADPYDIKKNVRCIISVFL